MYEGVTIRGGADEFQAAVIAIVLDHLAREENAARQRRTATGPGLPAWMRITSPLTQDESQVTPEGR
jgi:hypothetical protein